jgi:branched-chain amino acid transport system permease protein
MLMQKKYYWIAFAGLILAIVPAVLNDPFISHLGIRALTYSIVVMGLTLFAGYTGQISIGHAAFFGLAAYISGILVKAGVPFILASSISALSVAGVGCIVGILVLRTSGHYLALASIAVAVIIQVIIKNMTITGGPSGLTAVPPPSLFGWSITNDLSYYYFALICMVLGIVILARIIDSRTGDALRAIANNELAAQSLGIPVFKYKVLSFTISCVFAAVAGCLFVHYDGFIDPDRLSTHVSIMFLIMTFVGGLGNIFGSVIGAFALTIIEEYAQDFGEYNAFVYGLVLALVILYLPKGLVDLPNKIKSIVSR